MNTVIHKERQSYTKYDNEHYLLYINEQEAIFTEQESKVECPGYSYAGDMTDGGTLVAASNVTDENRRSAFIAGLIATKYSIDAQIAILANGKDTEQHETEYREFEQFRKECKAAIDNLLTR